MKTVILLFMVVASVVPVYAGQVITADFDELPAGVFVLSYYPGSSIGGWTDSYISRSAPNSLYSSTAQPIRFPGGVLWTTFYSGGGISIVYCEDANGNTSGMPSVELNAYAIGWQFVELNAPRPIAKINVVKPTQFGNYHIDDLSYELVPEPASVGSLAGLLGLSGLMRRRRRVKAIS